VLCGHVDGDIYKEDKQKGQNFGNPEPKRRNVALEVPENDADDVNKKVRQGYGLNVKTHGAIFM